MTQYNPHTPADATRQTALARLATIRAGVSRILALTEHRRGFTCATAECHRHAFMIDQCVTWIQSDLTAIERFNELHKDRRHATA